eukprot:m.376371 g.376371  ORF g.376371 m.376371 type:complete len:191 (+) comp20017_c4_seq3:1593-2165(+)
MSEGTVQALQELQLPLEKAQGRVAAMTHKRRVVTMCTAQAGALVTRGGGNVKPKALEAAEDSLGASEAQLEASEAQLGAAWRHIVKLERQLAEARSHTAMLQTQQQLQLQLVTEAQPSIAALQTRPAEQMLDDCQYILEKYWVQHVKNRKPCPYTVEKQVLPSSPNAVVAVGKLLQSNSVIGVGAASEAL